MVPQASVLWVPGMWAIASWCLKITPCCALRDHSWYPWGPPECVEIVLGISCFPGKLLPSEYRFDPQQFWVVLFTANFRPKYQLYCCIVFIYGWAPFILLCWYRVLIWYFITQISKNFNKRVKGIAQWFRILLSEYAVRICADLFPQFSS